MITRLSRREKLLVFGALPVVALVAGWHLIWVPLHEAKGDAQSRIAGFRQIRDAARRAQAAPPVIAQEVPDTPLATRVTRSAEKAGIALRRIETDGDALRVTLDDGDFGQLILWLADLDHSENVVVRAIEVDRRTEPGIVSSRLTLENL